MKSVKRQLSLGADRDNNLVLSTKRPLFKVRNIPKYQVQGIGSGSARHFLLLLGISGPTGPLLLVCKALEAFLWV